MSTTDTPVDSLPDNLDAFDDLFHGRTSSDEGTPEVEANPSDEEIEDENTDALELEDTQSDDDTVDAEDDTEDDDDEADAEPDVKPKKNRFQERINEFTRELRETQRQLEAIRAENERLKQTPEPTPTAPVVEDSGPSPEDTNEDGTDKYPLGEYDPNYVRDIARHTFQQEMTRAKAEEAQASEARKAQEERDKLGEEWTGKLASAQERYPDLTEKGENLVATFEGINQAYGEYLSSTIMGMEYGPDVLYYLANNVDEAQKIVSLGATRATIALGRIESKFADADNEKRVAKPRVSKAPVPPPSNRGTAVAVAEVPDDTDDLDAFAAKLFKKRRS